LEAGGAVEERGGLFYMALPWRNVLAEAVTVEVVEEGDESAGAVEAALARAAGRSDTRADDPAGAPAHPRRFAHKAYVALPAPLAERVRAWESLLRQDGVGVLAFGGDSPPRVVADTPRRTPLSWPDYYRVALALSAGAQSAPAAAAKDPAAAG